MIDKCMAKLLINISFVILSDWSAAQAGSPATGLRRRGGRVEGPAVAFLSQGGECLSFLHCKELPHAVAYWQRGEGSVPKGGTPQLVRQVFAFFIYKRFILCRLLFEKTQKYCRRNGAFSLEKLHDSVQQPAKKPPCALLETPRELENCSVE